MIAAEKHAVDFDMLRADIDRSALLLHEMRRMQIVQRVDDVDCDVGLLTCARMPDGGACDTDKQLSRSRGFGESVRRADHRIGTVQHGIARKMWEKAEVLHEGGERLKRSRREALHLGCSHLGPVVNHWNLSCVIEALETPYFRTEISGGKSNANAVVYYLSFGGAQCGEGRRGTRRSATR